MSTPSAPGHELHTSDAAGDERALLDAHDVRRVRAENPGPLTLTGTNTWLIGREPAWLIDPGPMLEEHLAHVLAAIDARGGLGGIALTHDHADHAGAASTLRELRPAPLAAGRGEADVRLRDGVQFGPLEAVATPGHASDHHAFIGHRACFTGDAVLGSGSVFIAPHPGALAGYLSALERLQGRDDFDVLCPGHGDPVRDPRARLAAYVEHRRERERRLLAALDDGRRTVPELLDSAWSEVPPELRPAAAVTLAAHLDKLADEGRLPAGVERPHVDGAQW